MHIIPIVTLVFSGALMGGFPECGGNVKKLVLTLAACTLVLSACGRKPAPDTASMAAPGDDSFGAADGAGDIRGSQADLVASAGTDRVLFALDSALLDGEAQAILARQLAWLQQNPAVSFTIEGHCDERGTRDYNLALGDRRANAAANYLIAQGISPDRVRTISYGKERPEALGSDEASHARNRRAVSIVIDQGLM